ncbi:MAG TPA: DUF1629 domain-containing protein [Longimicrobium sp.]
MTTRTPEPARKRYYLVSLDVASNSGTGVFFVNEEEALVNGRRVGYHERRVPGHPHPVFVGVPPLREKPKVVIPGTGAKAVDYDGMIPVFISSRAKRLLEGIDPGAFEFAECETATRRGNPIEPYWWMDVIRWVEKFDEARSDFEWYRDRFPTAPNAQDNPSMFRLYDIHMPAGFPDEYHAFRFAHFNGKAVFDEVIVDAWRAARLTGAMFTPLQPPTKADLKRHLSFINYPYWTERSHRP